MSGLPADICNQALDAIGSEITLGDIADGSREASVLLRAYGQCMRQLLRMANWNFAAKFEPMLLIADATGATLDVGAKVPFGFIYEYAYPIDCVRARFVYAHMTGLGIGSPQGNIAIPATPLFGSQGSTPAFNPERRARFKIANDPNYPMQPGENYNTAGVSPTGRVVILTNAPHAHLSYTALTLYPSMWDALFRAAFVAYLAAEVALPLSKDKKFGLEVRREQLQIAKAKVIEARIADGNEQPMSSDIKVDWMQSRYSGASRRPWEHDGGMGAFTTDFEGFL